jgi:photosystem II stability/assembly factor-like uncharacterized protein
MSMLISASDMPRVYRFARDLVLWCVVALLVACGGGGGGGGAASPPPDISITAQPTDLSTVDSVGVIFSVTVAGFADFRWQRNQGDTWTDIPNSNSSSLSTGMVHESDSGTRYRVIVTSRSSPANVIISSEVTLTVGPLVLPPTIVAQPTDIVLMAGQDGSLAVTATGSSLSFRWQRSRDSSSWSDIPGGTGPTLVLAAAAAGDDGLRHRVVVTNSGGSVTSVAALLSVTPAIAAPVFTRDPQTVTVAAGQPANLSAQAVGIPAPTLAWQRSTDGLAWFTIAGQVGGSLTTAPTALADNGTFYRAMATNSSGSVPSAPARLIVTSQPSAPTIQGQPAAVTVGMSGTARFEVVASGSPSPTYQWQVSVDGGATFNNITGSTLNPLYVAPLAVTDNNKQFRAVVSNSQGSINSSAALLNVLEAPAITLHPTDQGWRPGETNALFTVLAKGDQLHYQWQVSTDFGITYADVPGATGTSYVHGAGAAASVNAVRAVVRNAAGTSASFPGRLTALTWTHARPRPTGDGMLGIAWVDPTTLVAVGETRTILRSTDSGMSWAIVSENPSANATLFDIAFQGATGIAVGGFGTVKRSVDGGSHWVLVDIGNNRTLRGVAFLGSVATAIGDNGTLLRSVDSGASWISATTDAGTTDLYDVAYSSHGIGVAVGASGTILRSLNQGATWTRVRSGTGTLATVAFASADVAVAAGQDGTLFRSIDAGLTWQPVASPTSFWISSVHFGSAMVGAATTAQGSIVRTIDGGASWTAASPVLDSFLYAVRFGNASTAVAVGSTGAIRRTTDGGATWTNITGVPGSSLFGVAFATPNIGVAVGVGGTMLRSTDSGANWTSLAGTQTEQLQGISFADGSIGVAVGINGVLLRTIDTGATWTPVASGTPNSLYSVAFVSPTVGMVATSSGLLRSIDAGASWQPASGAAASLNAVAFGDASVGVAVGSGGAIFRTTDSGQTWSPVASGTTSTLFAVAFASPTTAVAVGQDGVMARSTDAGATWIAGRMPFYSDYWFYGIHFVSSTDGVAVGNYSTVMRTNNGGLTWWSDLSQKAATMMAVTSAGPTKVIAVGSAGTVLRNTGF